MASDSVNEEKGNGEPSPGIKRVVTGQYLWDAQENDTHREKTKATRLKDCCELIRCKSGQVHVQIPRDF